MKVLILTNELLITCGVSKHILYFLSEAKKNEEYEFFILTGGGDGINLFKDVCKEIIFFPHFQHQKRTFLNFIKSIACLWKLQRKYNFDIFHSHNHYAANIAKVVSYFFDIKTIQTLHGILDDIGRLSHFNANRYICVNEHIQNHIKDRNKNKYRNSIVIHSGVDCRDLNTKKSDKTIKIIAASRFIKAKGLDIFLHSISNLEHEVQNKVEVILAGKGERESEIQSYLTTMDCNIHYIGQVLNLIEFLKDTHIFVLPTISKEGLPMTILEAAATRNLIICSNYPGINSNLKNALLPFIFEVRDTDKLTDLLTEVVLNYKNYETHINSVQHYVCSEFSIEKMMDKTFKFYHENKLN